MLSEPHFQPYCEHGSYFDKIFWSCIASLLWQACFSHDTFFCDEKNIWQGRKHGSEIAGFKLSVWPQKFASGGSWEDIVAPVVCGN